MSRSRWTMLTTLLLIVALLLAACGGAAAPTATTAPAAQPTTAAAEPTTAAAEPTTAAAEPTMADAAAEPTSADAGAGTTGGAMAETKTIEVEDGAEIVFSGWGDETEQQVYRDSIARFNKLYPNVKVDYQPIPADFQTKLKAAMAGGTAADVFYVDDQLITAFGPTNQLLALDDAMAEAGIDREAFIQPLLSIFTIEDKTYALPKDWGTLGLIYLPEAFEQAGIDAPTDDWTWQDLMTAAKTIEEKTDFGGFCMGADWARLAPIVFSHGGSFANEDNTAATLDAPEVTQAAQLVVDMKEAGSLVTASDVGAGWCGEAIGKKLVATTLEGGWMVNFMKQNYADVEWQAVQVPSGPKGKADIIFTNGIGVNAATKYPKAAAALAVYLTSPENQAEIAKTGFAYPARTAQLNLIENPNDKAISQGSTFDLTRVAYWGPNTGKVNDAVSQALNRIFLGEQTTEEAFAQAQEEAQAALEGQ
jgi:multiple sugar transport system substrate-binding protein